MKSHKEQALEIVGLFSHIPYPTSPMSSKFYAGILIDSHVFSADNCPFLDGAALEKNNNYWKGVRQELNRLP